MNKCKKVTKQHGENYLIQMYRMEIRSPPPKLGVVSLTKKNQQLDFEGNIKAWVHFIFLDQENREYYFNCNFYQRCTIYQTLCQHFTNNEITVFVIERKPWKSTESFKTLA